MLQRKKHRLDSLELKALSVSSSLRFLLGVECQLVLCITKVGSRHPFSLYFPKFSETFRKLLSLCASRFQLTCEHFKGDGDSVLKGKAVIPLLRYADYLPGALHVDEILACLSLEPTIRARNSHNTSDKSDANGNIGNDGHSYEFEACFDDYTEFTADFSLNDAHGREFYLTLEYGLGMATHSHLVELVFHADQNYQNALQEFQEFSGWTKFDLRFYDDQFRSEGGIIVMPTVQDACDLLEKYEDEESDDDYDLLPFTLRPVAPLVPVPCVEDSVLCRQRNEHWDSIVAFWERFPNNKNTVVIYNLYSCATIAEILAFLSHLPIEEATMVEDDSPSHRRRLFVSFKTSQTTMQALELDGKSTKGRALRVQVAPPYISKDRRGLVVEGPLTGAALKPETGKAAATTTTTAGRRQKRGQTPPVTTPPTVATGSEDTKKNERAASAATLGHSAQKTTTLKNHNGASPIPEQEAKPAAPPSASPQLPVKSTTPVKAPALKTSSEPKAAANLSRNASFTVESQPLMLAKPRSSTTSVQVAATSPFSSPIAAPTTTALPTMTVSTTTAPTKTTPAAVPTTPTPSHMNADAKEFKPQFVLNPNSLEYHAEQPLLPVYAPLEKTAAAVVGGGRGGAAAYATVSLPPPPPPPYVSTALTPNLVYTVTASDTIAVEYASASASIKSILSEVNLAMPPPYSLPPPYIRGAGEGLKPMAPPPPLPPPRSHLDV